MLDIKEYFNLNDLYHFIPEVQQKLQEQRRGNNERGCTNPDPEKEVVDEDEINFQSFLKNKIQVGTPSEVEAAKDVRDVSFADNEGEFERYEDNKKTAFADTLRIVGQEENGELLVIADQRGDKTILSMFSVNLMHWTTIHEWDQRLDIVSATVSPNKQTVGVSYRFTTQDDTTNQEKKEDNKNEGREEEKEVKEEDQKEVLEEEKAKDASQKTYFYNTFIQSVGSSQKYVLSEDSKMPQKIQFISEELGKHTISYRFLHTIAGERIDIIGVTTENTAPFVHTKKPWKMYRVCGPHLWSGIFSCPGENTNNLCTIEERILKGGQQTEQQCIHVTPLCADKPLKAQTEHITAEILNAESVKAVALENPTYEGPLFPYALNIPSKEASFIKPLPSVTALELPSGSQCICIQHNFSEDKTSTNVTIIELESHMRMDFTIPIPADKFLNPTNVRVMFDIFTDYVMIYIPGYYTHLLDLSGHHDPCLGVISKAAITPLPPTRSRSPRTPFVTAFSLGPGMTISSKKKHLLDMNTGIVYEYNIKRSFFINACRSNDKYLQEALLHGAATHLGDMRLAQEMISIIVSENSACATSQLFKEFIIAATYVKHRISDQGQTSTGTPLTAHFLPSSLSRIEKLNIVTNVKVSGYDTTTNEDGDDSRQIILKKLWRYPTSFKVGFETAISNDEDEDDNNIDDIMSKVTVHGDTVLGVTIQLSAALSSFYPKITEKRASDAALIYIKSQDDVVSDLFATITIGMAQQKIRTRFRFLENFFCALDELGQVCTPPGFWTEFGTLGLLCLPQTMFVQYIERGKMKVTKNFVRRMLFTEDTKKNSPKLSYYFLSKFTVNTVLLLLAEARKKDLPDFLVERTFSEGFPWTLGTDIELGEDYDDSRFLPISFLLDSVAKVVEEEKKRNPTYNPPLSEIVKRLDSDKLFTSLKF